MHCRLWSSCLLLVTTLPRCLALAALARSSSSSSSSSSASSIVWSRPAPDDRFGPGDTIVGEWQVTAQQIVSPSFRLCAGGEDGCGATIWPEVVEESAGTYHVYMTSPNVTTESGYYIQMKDDFGHPYPSPIFKLTPTPQMKDKSAEGPPDVTQPRPEQAPMSSSSHSTGAKSNGTSNSDPATPAVAVPADPGGTLSPPSAAGAPPSPATTVTPGTSAGGGSGPLVAAAHSAPPTAALAVPLSLAGAIVLLASGLAFHHRGKLAAERERCTARQSGLAAQLATTNDSSGPALRHLRSFGLALDMGGGGGGSQGGGKYDDVEKALFARTLLRGGFSDHTHDAYYDRHPGRAALTADGLYSYTRSHARRAPEPRQRTRQLSQLTREFTNRLRAQPSSSRTQSRTSYRRALGDRQDIRRGANTGRESSLWRSLSIARRKAAPLSALASPAMTESMTSVTSEVLPSYLPSPDFGGTADQMCGYGDRAGVGDAGFENVPLSPPPPPPPLHTRGEATEPEDARTRELRGVYEAVARALGSVRRE